VKKKLYLLECERRPIFEQLQLEEALLRCDTRNVCIINYGSEPSIVMGISSKAEKLVHIDQAAHKKVPLIRRFSGGGCIVADDNTLFISWILGKELLEDDLYVETIHAFAADIYKNSWDIPGFALKENDYVIADRKCGGNAQYLRKDRFVHHTTFLWDLNPLLMNLLHLPEKRPAYRKKRDHLAFVTTLEKYFTDMKHPAEKLKNYLQKKYTIIPISWDDLDSVRKKPHRKSVSIIESSASGTCAMHSQPVL
jgi:lipoate---protein ligase